MHNKAALPARLWRGVSDVIVAGVAESSAIAHNIVIPLASLPVVPFLRRSGAAG
jgi:hypothetical protein